MPLFVRGANAAVKSKAKNQNSNHDWRNRCEETFAEMMLAEKKFAEQPVESKTERRLTLVMAGVIVLSILVMGVQIDVGNDDNAIVFEGLEMCFCVLFVIEILMRLFYERIRWIRNPWNWLDLTLVAFSLVSAALKDSDLYIMNMLRIARLARLIRMVKVLKSFQGLYIVLMAWWSAMTSIVHVYGMLAAGIYIYALVITQFVGRSEQFEGVMLGDRNVEDTFGSIYMSMYTLFTLMTLEGFGETTYPIVSRQPLFLLFFVSFILLFTFGLLNMLVGLVVERTLSESARLQSDAKGYADHLKMSELQQLYDICDEDGTGRLERARFVEVLGTDATAMTLFKNTGIKVPHLSDLFNILDWEGDGILDREEFVHGIVKMHEAVEFQVETLATHAGVRNLRLRMDHLTSIVEEVLGANSSSHPPKQPGAGDKSPKEAAQKKSGTPDEIPYERSQEDAAQQPQVVRSVESLEKNFKELRTPFDSLEKNFKELADSVSVQLYESSIPPHSGDPLAEDTLAAQIRAMDLALAEKMDNNVKTLCNLQLTALQQQSSVICERLDEMLHRMCYIQTDALQKIWEQQPGSPPATVMTMTMTTAADSSLRTERQNFLAETLATSSKKFDSMESGLAPISNQVATVEPSTVER